MKKYTKPEIEINIFTTDDIITASGTKGLTNKGANGQPLSESYSSLFGGK